MEIHSAKDPYMILAANRDDLGVDFDVFIYLAYGSWVIAGLALIWSFLLYFCLLEKGADLAYNQSEENPYLSGS